MAGGTRLPTQGGELGTRARVDHLTRSWHTLGQPLAALIATVKNEGKPTVRQVYALAAALCERLGEEVPASRADASELIECLRTENGHPAPKLDDARP